MGRWNVADVMTIGAISVQEDTPFKEIVDLLEAHGINAAPVIDGFDRVVGVVSSADLVPKIEFAGDDGHRRLFENRHTRQARGKAHGTAAGERVDERPGGHGHEHHVRGRRSANHGDGSAQAAPGRRRHGPAHRHGDPPGPAEGVPAPG